MAGPNPPQGLAISKRNVPYQKAGASLGGLAPNFADDLCATTLERESKPPAFDFSSWSIVADGAERMRSATLQRFIERCVGGGVMGWSSLPSHGMVKVTELATSDNRGSRPILGHARAPWLSAGGAEGQAANVRWMTSSVVQHVNAWPAGSARRATNPG